MDTEADTGPAWPPGGISLDVRRAGGQSPDEPITLVVRHPQAPFIRGIAALADGGPELAELLAAVTDYLSGVGQLPPSWIRALGSPREASTGIAWLPLGLGRRAWASEGMGSRLVEAGGHQAPSRTVVLNAAPQARLRRGWVVLGSEYGLRVVVHLSPAEANRLRLRCYGFTASLPFGAYDDDAETGLLAFSGEEDVLVAAREAVAAQLRLAPKTVFIRGVRPKPGSALELRMRGIPLPWHDGGPPGPPREFLISGIGRMRAPFRITSVTATPLAACADALVLRCDPASAGTSRNIRARRPTRSQAAFAPAAALRATPVPLEAPRLLQVKRSRLVKADAGKADPKAVPLPPPPPFRSHDYGAIGGFHNLSELFVRLAAYGIDAEDYFYAAALPLECFYRSGIRPGPGKDGNTVNGRVQPKGWGPADVISPTPGDRPCLEIHLAMGCLSTRARGAWTPGGPPVQAEPLGFGADPRWIWHELGHVMLMATTGELEFRFAHSLGDALAAVASDPESRLADEPPWRGLTFPWVFAPRRHDRCVLHGWGWAGRLRDELSTRGEEGRLRRKGYQSEQILSSTLFRLYRCLGGDTPAPPPSATGATPRRETAEAASDHAIFLMMQALRLLGDARLVPARLPEQLAAALCDADESSEACPTRYGPRTGGCATKLVRWAFEAQGLYQVPPDCRRDGPGAPPAVDVFIADRRPTVEALPEGEVAHGPGGYVPVPLDWGGAAPPAWFATEAAVRIGPDQIEVTVGNRGALDAAETVVRVWYHPWPDGSDPPVWNPTWPRLDGAAVQTVPSKGEALFAVARPAAVGRHLYLAEASGLNDRSIIDPAGGLACATRPTPLDVMVPGDNNLGLAVA